MDNWRAFLKLVVNFRNEENAGNYLLNLTNIFCKEGFLAMGVRQQEK
jgi:hypothetical protein